MIQTNGSYFRSISNPSESSLRIFSALFIAFLCFPHLFVMWWNKLFQNFYSIESYIAAFINFFLALLLHISAITTATAEEALESTNNKKQLLGVLGQCGSWNDLATIHCTATEKVNVHYTMEIHNLKMRIDFKKENLESAEIAYRPKPQGSGLRGPETPTLTLPTWTNIPADQSDPSSTGGITYLSGYANGLPSSIYFKLPLS